MNLYLTALSIWPEIMYLCRKIYMREMDERLVLDKSITETYYADKDVHWSFSGLIEHVYI